MRKHLRIETLPPISGAAVATSRKYKRDLRIIGVSMFLSIDGGADVRPRTLRLIVQQNGIPIWELAAQMTPPAGTQEVKVCFGHGLQHSTITTDSGNKFIAVPLPANMVVPEGAEFMLRVDDTTGADSGDRIRIVTQDVDVE